MMIVGDNFCYNIVGKTDKGLIGQTEENNQLVEYVLPYVNNSVDVSKAYKRKGD
ncbi:MAG: hypothetical protein ACOCRO_08455 [Halanaerobiales bacterium]